jgi:hypothetical protein
MIQTRAAALPEPVVLEMFVRLQPRIAALVFILGITPHVILTHATDQPNAPRRNIRVLRFAVTKPIRHAVDLSPDVARKIQHVAMQDRAA